MGNPVSDALQRYRSLEPWARNALLFLAVLACWPVAAAMLSSGLPPGVVLLGAVLGSLSGMSAVGLVLIYRAARIVNFTQATLGSAAGVFAIMLYSAWHWNYFVAFPIGILAAAVAGAAIDVLVIRRFFWAPRLILTLATIGLAQILGGMEIGIPVLWNRPAIGSGFSTPLSFTFEVGGQTFNGNHVMIMIVAPVAMGALAWFLRGTDAGTGIRAASENAERAMLLGVPVRRLSTIVWMVAAAFSATSFMLGAPLLGYGTSVAGSSAAILPALAAAVLARMESLPKAFFAGVFLGIVTQAVKWNSDSLSFSDVILLGVVLIGLLLQRDKLSRADDASASSWVGARETPPVPSELRHLPEVVWVRRGLLAAAVVFALALPSFLSVSQINLLGTLTAMYAIVAISLVVLTGWAGQISLGQFAFVGIGAVAAANMLSNGWDLFLALPFAALCAGLAAVAVGLPALRIRGLFLAVTSLALAVPAASYFLNPAYFRSILPNPVDRVLLLERFPLLEEDNLYRFSLLVLLGVIVVATGLRRSRAGRVLLAVRDNERAAQARGVPVMRVKLMAFAISGAMAGLAGALHVMVVQGIGYGTYGTQQSFKAFSMVVIGGLTSVGGGVLGAATLSGAEFVFSGGLQLVVTGTGVLLLLLFFPGGLGEIALRGRQRYLRWVANRRAIVVPSLVADKRVEELGASVRALRIEDLFAAEAIEVEAALEPMGSPRRVAGGGRSVGTNGANGTNGAGLRSDGRRADGRRAAGNQPTERVRRRPGWTEVDLRDSPGGRDARSRATGERDRGTRDRSPRLRAEGAEPEPTGGEAPRAPMRIRRSEGDRPEGPPRRRPL